MVVVHGAAVPRAAVLQEHGAGLDLARREHPTWHAQVEKCDNMVDLSMAISGLGGFLLSPRSGRVVGPDGTNYLPRERGRSEKQTEYRPARSKQNSCGLSCVCVFVPPYTHTPMLDHRVGARGLTEVLSCPWTIELMPRTNEGEGPFDDRGWWLPVFHSPCSSTIRCDRASCVGWHLSLVRQRRRCNA